MKNISTLSFIVLANMCSVAPAYAQSRIEDDFGDGNFTSSPTWDGTSAHFIVNSVFQLQLNNTVAGSSWLSTAFKPPTDEDVEWELYVKQSFAGSANNYGRIYLLSNESNLTQTTEGYYLQLGEAGNNDAVELFRQSGAASVSVCRSANATIPSSFAIRIKVKRSVAGVWEILIDYNGGTAFTSAASGTDQTYTSGLYFGVVCVYTAGNANRFYFDDVHAGTKRIDPPPGNVAQANDVVINEFFADPSPSVGLPTQEFVEIYNRSAKTFDLTGWRIGDATSLTTLPKFLLMPGQYVVITNSSGLPDYQSFGDAISVSAFPSLNNTGDAIHIQNQHGLRIDSLNYNLDWYHVGNMNGGGYTIERLNPEAPSNDITNWYVSLAENGGTPGKVNSVFGRNPDSEPPSILNLSIDGLDHVVIEFSEKMNAVEVEDLTRYQLEGSGVIRSISYDQTTLKATVALAEIVNGATYVLHFSELHDVAGNKLPAQKFTFTPFIAHPVQPKDVIITELMADPSPTVQQPDAEYIEVLNRSQHAISLSQWQLTDGTSKAILPAVILQPQQYLVVTSTTNISKFQHLAGAVGVSNFPSLGNSADKIVLVSKELKAIDSVSYDLTWYRSIEKSEGGWSLELIDPENICGEENNWTSSEDISGGTPGRLNSVFANKPDVTSPRIVSVSLVSSDTVLIKVNERLNKSSLDASVSISPGIFSGYLSFADSRYRSMYFVLNEKLPFGTPYSINVSGISDCAGNYADEQAYQCYLPEKANSGDVVINEVLFNPRSEQADFIELYNRSSKYIEVKHWSLSGKSVGDSNDILLPHSYRLYTSSMLSVQSNYPHSVVEVMRQTQMPSLPDDEGTVELRDNLGNVIDHFDYSEDMHNPILQDKEGVSLERISLDVATTDRSNWRSANGSDDFATPGFANSNSRSFQVLDEDGLTIIPEVINKSGPASFAQLRYQFSESGRIANVRVVDLEGRTVKIIASNETIGSEGAFQWDGDQGSGGRARAGYYLIWFEVFDLDGNVTTYRKRVIVAL